MQSLKHFEHVGKRGFYRPIGTVTFDRAVEMAAESMRHARALELMDLMINSIGLVGFPSPDDFQRYALAKKWAESAGATLAVALVCRPEVMDPQKIALLMAQNRGVAGDVFLNELDALSWLDARLSGTSVTLAGADPLFKPPTP